MQLKNSLGLLNLMFYQFHVEVFLKNVVAEKDGMKK